MTIVLCGFKNCGKTTLGKSLAKKISADFIDTDDLIVDVYKGKGAHKGKGDGDVTIGDVFLSLGEEKFRDLERKIIKGLKPKKGSVIATGGGAILDDVSVELLKGYGKLIYLSVPKNELLTRLMKRVNKPAFMKGQDPKKAFRSYFADREQRYLAIADVVVDLKRKSPTKWVSELMKIMEKSE
jgi:shikimate kinase